MIRMRNEKNFDEKYARVMDDPKTEKYCFADQIEFILYAKRCKDEGKKNGIVWVADSSYHDLYMCGYNLFERGQYEETWRWLDERGCAIYVKKELIEQYALYMQRWIQCEEGINQYGLLAKHPTTQLPIASPYVNMGISFLKQANVLWLQIYQIVKDNCETPIGASNPNDDLMERLLG